MCEGVANADVSEIEITPEMRRAGSLAFTSFNPLFESEETAAVRVFRAMLRACARGAPAPSGSGRGNRVSNTLEQLSEDDLG